MYNIYIYIYRLICSYESSSSFVLQTNILGTFWEQSENLTNPLDEDIPWRTKIRTPPMPPSPPEVWTHCPRKLNMSLKKDHFKRKSHFPTIIFQGQAGVMNYLLIMVVNNPLLDARGTGPSFHACRLSLTAQG